MGIIQDLYKKGVYCENPYNRLHEITIKDHFNQIYQLNTVVQNKTTMLLCLNTKNSNSAQFIENVVSSIDPSVNLILIENFDVSPTNLDEDGQNAIVNLILKVPNAVFIRDVNN